MKIDSELELHTDRLILKILDPGYCNPIFNYYLYNKAFFSRFIPLYADTFTSGNAVLEQLWQEYDLMLEERALRFYLFAHDDYIYSKILGDVSVSNIIYGGLNQCQIGYKLDQASTGSGYMREAVLRVTGMIFQDLRLHRIEAYIMPENIKSIRLVESLNFQLEGIAKEYMMVGGRWEDHLRFVLFNPKDN